MAFFTIIIPTYNRAHIIRRPIDSIIAQTFKDWELIIVDDGSTDDTKDLIDSYQDSRIRYIWQNNQERSAARNHGISLAQGEWVCFQDSDDEYLPEHLEVLHRNILLHHTVKTIRTGLLIYENGSFKKKSGYLVQDSFSQYPFECFTTAAFHSSVLKDINFNPSIFINEDLHFLLKLGLKYDMLVLAEWTGVYHYDPRSSGGIGVNYERNLLNRKLCLDDILRWNKELIQPYLKRARCLTEVLLLNGHLLYNKRQVPKAIIDNVKIFFRFPTEYTKLLLRIFYVKIGEFSGLYRTQDRF